MDVVVLCWGHHKRMYAGTKQLGDAVILADREVILGRILRRLQDYGQENANTSSSSIAQIAIHGLLKMKIKDRTM